MRFAVLSILILLAAPLAAFEIEDETLFDVADPRRTLRVISTADTDLFAPLITAFQAEYPRVAVAYTTVSSAEVMTALAEERAPFDLAVSSAMDLQTKLANDGHTRPHNSALTGRVPDWGKWRDHVFAFTQEPAAIVISPQTFGGLPVPRSRQDLIALLREHPDRFRGRVGTYDVRLSGLGYLFATQDARMSETYWRLAEVMGSLDARLYCCSGSMIDDVASGRIAVAYNVLGSYAAAREDLEGQIEIIEPEDFTTVMLRTAVIPATAEAPDLGALFLDHLIETAWTDTPAAAYPFPPMAVDGGGAGSALRPIPLGPGLLVFLDRLKRSRFLEAWGDAMLPVEGQ
ncbi:MAG: ABC transporter substrate-binding protein [Pseudomonadota bacterium]